MHGDVECAALFFSSGPGSDVAERGDDYDRSVCRAALGEDVEGTDFCSCLWGSGSGGVPVWVSGSGALVAGVATAVDSALAAPGGSGGSEEDGSRDDRGSGVSVECVGGSVGGVYGGSTYCGFV